MRLSKPAELEKATAAQRADSAAPWSYGDTKIENRSVSPVLAQEECKDWQTPQPWNFPHAASGAAA